MEKTENQVLLDAGAALSVARSVAGGRVPYCVVQENYEIKELEFLLPKPTRKRASVSVHDVDSFCLYFGRHGTGSSSIYADINRITGKFDVTAVIDDHGVEDPGWREHTCCLFRNQSVEWSRWINNNKSNRDQPSFATFIEDNLADIVSSDGLPSGGEMLQMAIAFERTADKRLKSKVNLQSGGVRFEYVDDDNNETRTSMQVFSRFMIGIPVFDGAKNAYQIEARLKYRDNNGKLSFWYELIRPDRAFKQAVDDEMRLIEATTGATIIRGTWR